MKKQEEPAEKLLTLTPAASTTFALDGFVSTLYTPAKDQYPGKALIMVGGSDGLYSLTKLIAEQFVKEGLTVLALAYWNLDELPTQIYKIPLEFTKKAADWLKERGYEKIGLWGISEGAVYALLSASHFDVFSACVAVNPMSYASPGLQKKNQWHKKVKLLDGSAFTFHEKDIPFHHLSFPKKKVLWESLKRQELCLLPIYRNSVEKSNVRSRIPVEKIKGSVLFLAAEEDSMWESAKASEAMMQRLKDYNFNHPYRYYHYKKASHLLLPYSLNSRKMYRIERKYPEECQKSNMDAFRKTLDFLKESW